VSVFGLQECRLLARGQGHKCWVSNILHDTYAPSPDGYRVVSTGLDCSLMMWNFLPSSWAETQSAPLSQPASERLVVGDVVAAPPARVSSDSLPEPPGILRHEERALQRDVPSPSLIAVRPTDPAAKHRAHTEPIVGLALLKNEIVTIAWTGCVKFWGRPAPP